MTSSFVVSSAATSIKSILLSARQAKHCITAPHTTPTHMERQAPYAVKGLRRIVGWCGWVATKSRVWCSTGSLSPKASTSKSWRISPQLGGSTARISAKFRKTFLLVVDAHNPSAADDYYGEVSRSNYGSFLVARNNAGGSRARGRQLRR